MKDKISAIDVTLGNKEFADALNELIDVSKGHDKLPWDDICNPRNGGQSAYYVMCIGKILEDPHTGALPKVWKMSNRKVMLFCSMLLRHLWFQGGLFEVYQELDFIPRINDDFRKIKEKQKKKESK